MENIHPDLLPLVSIEHLCHTITGARTVTAKLHCMRALLTEIEYAIEKYRAMFKRIRQALPPDLTNADFEPWQDKLYSGHASHLLKDIKYYDADYFNHQDEEDEDILSALRQLDGNTILCRNGRYLHTGTQLLADEYLALRIDKEKDWELQPPQVQQPQGQPLRGQQPQGQPLRGNHPRGESASTPASLRIQLLQLHVGELLVKRMDELSSCIYKIRFRLENPFSEALYNLGSDYEIRFSTQGGDTACQDFVERWIEDHRGTPDYLQQLDAELAKLRSDIRAKSYGDLLRHIVMKDDEEDFWQDADLHIGQHIFCHLDQFRQDPALANELFTDITIWYLLHVEKQRVETLYHAAHAKAKAQLQEALKQKAQKENEQQEKQRAALTPSQPAHQLPPHYTHELRSNPQATQRLSDILHQHEPRICSPTGKRSEKWKWSHVKEAMTNLHLIDPEIAYTDFGRAIHAILSNRSEESVTQSVKRDSSDKRFPTDTDRSIIADIEKLLRPVADLLRGGNDLPRAEGSSTD